MKSGVKDFNYFFREQTDQVGKFSRVFKRMIMFCLEDWGAGSPLVSPLHWHFLQVSAVVDNKSRNASWCGKLWNPDWVYMLFRSFKFVWFINIFQGAFAGWLWIFLQL